MQKRLIIIGIAAVTFTTGGHVSAQNTAEPAQRQSLLNRLRERSANQQVQTPQQTEIAQTRGYRPGVTIPQQQQQQTPVPQQPVYSQQAQYPAYPPQQQVAPGQVQGQQPRPQQPYNMQARQTPPTGAAVQQQTQQQQQQPRPTASSSSSSSSNDSDNNRNRSSSSSSSSRSGSTSGNSSRSSSGSSPSSSRSSDDSDSKSSSKKSSSSSKSDSNDSDSKKSSSKSESSALKKIADKVDSDNDSDSDSKKESSKSEKKEEPKKSEEEIAREKAHAAFLKAADEATTVVATFLKQANDGYYSKASDSLSPAIKKYFASEISAVNGTEKTVLDELTANGTITMVTYVNTTVRGEGAVVEAELGYADGRTARRSFDLIKIDDDWKIVLPVTGIMAENGSAARSGAAVPASNAAASNSAERAAAANVAAHAAATPPTAEQAAARASLPLVLAPDATTSAPQ